MPSLDAEGLDMALSELSGYVALVRLCRLGRDGEAPRAGSCHLRSARRPLAGQAPAEPGPAGWGSGLDATLAFLASGPAALIGVVLAWAASPSVK